MKKIANFFLLIMASFLIITNAEASFTNCDMSRQYDILADNGTVEINLLDGTGSAGVWDVSDSTGIITDSAYASIYQYSNIISGDNTLSVIGAIGNGTAVVTNGFSHNRAWAINLISVYFTINQPVFYSLLIDNIGPEGETHILLRDETTNYIDGVSGSGTLSPGSYWFEIDSSAYADSEYDIDDSASYSVNFTATTVPLPPSALLMISSLIGIVGIRKKFKK